MSSLEHIKAGDIIATKNHFDNMRDKEPRISYALHTVDRVTQTQIVCGHRRFRKSDGVLLKYGGAIVAIEATPELQARVAAETAVFAEFNESFGVMREMIVKHNRIGLSADQLIAVTRAYKAASAAADGSNTATYRPLHMGKS